MKLSERGYKKVEALRAKHPEKTTKTLLSMANVKLSNYYRGKAESKTVAKKTKTFKRRVKRPAYEQIQVQPQSSGMIPVVMLTPEQFKGMFQ